MRLFEVAQTKLQPFSTDPVTPNQMDMMKDPEYMANKKGMVGKIEWMSPKEYIDKCVAGFRSIGEPGEVQRGRDPKLIKKYAQEMQSGDKFPMLELDYRGGFGQEGLHRAMAAQAIRVEEVPVFVTTESPEFKERREQERKAEMDRIKGQLTDFDKERQSSVVDDILGAFDEDLNEYTEITHDTENDEGNIFGYVVDTDEEQLVNYFVYNHGISESIIDKIRSKYNTVAVARGMVVEEEYKNRGLGTELLQAFIDEAVCVADAFEDNDFDLVKWYKSWGFEIITQAGSGPMMVMEL
jgi:GNAT superfamily N-acetyltransferase